MEEENLEIYSLIWLDGTVDSSEEKLNIQRKLRSSINYLKTFNNEYECENYLLSTSNNERIILIISGQLGKHLINHIHHLTQIISIYIFCIDKNKYLIWSNQFLKIKGIITQSDELISQIEYEKTRRNHIKIDEPLSISIFNENNEKEDDECLIDNQFIYSQLLINSLLEMKIFVKDKNEFLNICENFYRQNEEILLIIEEFKKEYKSLNALWWLTRNTFLSSIINKAFQRKNFQILFLSRFFLQDILKELKLNKSNKLLRLYKTHLFTNKQIEIFENLNGKIISINQFFLTNLVRKQSLSYLKELIIPDHLHSILFQIDADPKLNGIKSFANITSLSYFNGEQQILFLPGTIFRINQILNNDKKLFIIQMTLCNYYQSEFKLINHLEEFDLLSFGHMIIDMHKYNQAQIYFNHLIHHLPFKHPHIPICYDALAKISLEKGQYYSSIKSYKKSLEIKIHLYGKNHFYIGEIYNNIAQVYLKINDYQNALESFDFALNIFENKSSYENYLYITQCFNNIALIYKYEKNYEKSLEFYNKSLFIYEKYLNNNSPDLAMSHTNIGLIYKHLNQYDLALEHYNKALNIYLNIIPMKHSLISMIYENIGNIYYDQKQFQQGLDFYEKASQIYNSLLPSTHPDVLQIQMIIKRIQSKIKYL